MLRLNDIVAADKHPLMVDGQQSIARRFIVLRLTQGRDPCVIRALLSNIYRATLSPRPQSIPRQRVGGASMRCATGR
jgi:hypothetical protein